MFPGAGNPHYFSEHLEEGLDVSEVHDIWLGWTNESNHIEDVSGYFDTKIAALAKHESQLTEGIRFFEEFLAKEAVELGEKIGASHAEDFRVLDAELGPSGESGGTRPGTRTLPDLSHRDGDSAVTAVASDAKAELHAVAGANRERFVRGARQQAEVALRLRLTRFQRQRLEGARAESCSIAEMLPGGAMIQ